MNSKAQMEVIILIVVFIAVISYGIYSVVQINDQQGADTNQLDVNQNNNSLTQIISPNNNTLLNQNNNSNNQAPIPTGQSNGSNSSSQGSNQENDNEEDNSASQNNSSQSNASEETNVDAEDDYVDINDDDSGAIEIPSDYEEEEEDADSNYTVPVPPQPPINPPTIPTGVFTNIYASAPNTSYNTSEPFTLTISTNVPGVYLTQISIFKNEEYTTNCQPNLPGSTSPTDGQYYSFGGQTNSSNQFIVPFNSGCTEVGQYSFVVYASYGGVSKNTTFTLNISTFAPVNGEIMYLEHLMYINTNSETRAGSYKLMRDLDFQDSSNYLNPLNKIAWTTGSGWDPIGYIHDNSVVGFTGNFNGNNKKIKNLYINKPTTDNLGLFGVIKPNANISNLILENVNITGQNYVSGLVSDNGGNISNCQVSGLVNSPSINTSNYVIGGLAGLNYGTITNCIFSGNVSGVDDVGGLAGKNFVGVSDIGGKIYNSSSSGRVFGINSSTGGLVGDNSYGLIKDSNSTSTVNGKNNVGGLSGFMGKFSVAAGKIENSYFLGDVNGFNYVGGLVGYNERGDINNSYFQGVIIGNIGVGGIAGYNGKGTISASYSTRDIKGVDNVGGLVGESNNQSIISSSYSTGNIIGQDKVGGVIGINKGTISSSYSTGSVSGRSFAGGLVGRNWEGTISSSYATGKTTGSDNVGGFAGGTWYGTISSSYATGEVSGSSPVGGFIGNNAYGTISLSSAIGAVIGYSLVGGFAGTNYGLISSSYSKGTVSGSWSSVGGFIGENTVGSITNCYSIGNIVRIQEAPGTAFSGFVGWSGGQYSGGIVNCYSIGKVIYEGSTNPTNAGFSQNNLSQTSSGNFWDTSNSQQSTSPSNAIGKITSDMKIQSTFTDSGWNFTNIWVINSNVNNGYPHLQNNLPN
ncbi:MAG: GLUG motif-containing protein [archaeon]|jgi:hypothetical protein